MNTFFTRIKLLLFFFPVLALFFPQFGHAADTSTVASVALYDGADRQQRLVAAAKKEGSLLLYTSFAPKDLAVLVQGFEKKYGIKVNNWRASSNDVLQRVMTESTANRFEADVVHISAPEMEALHREKLLQPAKSPYFKDIVPAWLPAHREWVSTYLIVFAQAYNTEKVKKEELPKSYRDFLDPRWKGRLGLEEKSQEWFYAVVKSMGEEKGLKFFRDLVVINKPSVRSGHSTLNNMVVSGEVPFALAVYNYMPAQAKRQGAPVDWFVLDPAIARGNGIGLSKKAPHPNAAMLFYDYLISDGQQMLAKMQFIPTVKNVESPLKEKHLTLIDPAASLNEYDRATKLYEEIIFNK